MQAQAAGLWPSQPLPPFVEDVFSTYLYAGTGANQTITNGVNESGKGAMTWIKCRTDATSHALYDTERGAGRYLTPNATSAQATSGSSRGLSSFNLTGFSLDDDSFSGRTNQSGQNYTSWTFRKQEKFFDIVTWTGDGMDNRQISHSLGSVPGCIIVKATSGSYTRGWAVWHRGINPTSTNNMVYLNTTAAQTTEGIFFNTLPTASVFTLSSDPFVNGPNIGTPTTYVAYLFAHDAGGFGLNGTDNVISCGSFTCPGSGGVDVNLGYEPQWILTKKVSGTENWNTWDTMRGWALTNQAFLAPNLSSAETTFSGVDYFYPTATGFRLNSSFGLIGDYIYIAIRRGPMRVPTDGTKVFKPLGKSPASTTSGVGFPADMSLAKYAISSQDWLNSSRLTNKILYTNSTGAEDSIFGPAGPQPFDTQDGFKLTTISTTDYAFWAFRRAPGFFDEVCYTGTGSATTQTHNLGVAPELVIWKRRSSTSDWRVWQSSFSVNDGLYLNLTSAKDTDSNVQTAIPTATVLNLATGAYTNASGSTYVAYLFASCPGVSKVGSVTHVEPTTVVCGFIPRFIMIKSTTATGTDDWFVFDSARGLVPGNDPYLRLNSPGAENTPFGAADLVDVTSNGFIMNGFGGGNYIFLAIA
jgi:hypothetical protein